MKKTHYDIYCDGSFRLPNYGAYAVLILQNGKEITSFAKPIFDSTINVMELQAIYEALSYFPDPVSVTIYSDSQYAVNCITKWAAHWQRCNWVTTNGLPVKNKALIESIIPLTKKHKVKLLWIRGHAGNVHNETCDRLAQDLTRAMAAKRILPPSPVLEMSA